MFEQPTKADLDRNLSSILHSARKKAQAERRRLTSELAARGLAQSGALIGSVTQSVDKIHSNAMAEAMEVLRNFGSRMAEPMSTLTSWARPHIENLGTAILSEIPAAGFPAQQQQLRRQYEAVFRQRQEGALRDIEIGFIGGRSVQMENETSQARALRLLKAIYDHTLKGADPVFVDELAPSLSMTNEQAQAGWHYLRDRGLIQTFGANYAARVNALGIDAIENAQNKPDRPSNAFPSVTYNILNIGTATNSAIQQAGAMSAQTQTANYSSEELASLARLVAEFVAHLDELDLDARGKQRARAQLATLETELSDIPDRGIVQQAGRTLRNITEGAIGSLVATAAQPTIWTGVAAAMSALFS